MSDLIAIVPRKFLVPLLILIGFAGCTHRVSVEQYPMKEGMVTSSLGEGPVNVINAQDSVGEELIGQIGFDKYLANLQEWTDIAIKVLKTELNDRNIMTNTEAEKTLKLAITDANFYQAAFAIRCKLDLRVEIGYGDTMEFTGDNNSPWTLYRACGGAVVRAVAAMLNHPNILYYLNN
jgi:hypothetical protein